MFHLVLFNEEINALLKKMIKHGVQCTFDQIPCSVAHFSTANELPNRGPINKRTHRHKPFRLLLLKAEAV
jgi:hypothetical protein